MKRKSLRLISFLVTLFIIISLSVLPTSAISYSNDVKTLSDSILLVNMDTGQVVFEKDPDSKRYPASTTKIMTYIVAVENIADLDNTRIPIKQEVLDTLKGTGSSMANLEAHVGKTMSAIDLLYSMMVPSGNDASVVLADYVGGGSIDKFVDMMNAKAKELGCENTHFQNPDGLHHDDHYTTARDLYKMTNYALTLPKFEKITNTTTYYCEGDNYPLITTNYMIDQNRGGQYYYMYANGIKTGTTNEAGRCLVTTATADGYSYMAILLHAPYYEYGRDESELTYEEVFKECEKKTSQNGNTVYKISSKSDYDIDFYFYDIAGEPVEYNYYELHISSDGVTINDINLFDKDGNPVEYNYHEKDVFVNEYGTMTDAADLFRWSLTQLELKTVRTSKIPICEQAVKLAWGRDSVNLVPEKNLSAIVPKNMDDTDLIIETDLPDVINAPLSLDQVVGTATIYYREDENSEKQELAKVNLVPMEAIERSGILFVIDVMVTVVTSIWFLLVIGIIAVLLIIYFISARINRKRNKKNRRVKHYRNL